MLPPYLLPGSPWEDDWLNDHPTGWTKPAPSEPKMASRSLATHHAAATGDIQRLQELAKNNRHLLVAEDENGWQPLHEAIRAGDLETVKFLLQNGANKNAVAGVLGTSLFVAKLYLEQGHEIIHHLESLGAVDAASDEL
jgi:ankyrin repeat protein